MRISEIRLLISERSTREKLIAATPEDQILTRRSLAARLQKVNSAIGVSPIDKLESAALRLDNECPDEIGPVTESDAEGDAK